LILLKPNLVISTQFARFQRLPDFFNGIGALQPLATTFPQVSGSLYSVLEIAAISVAVATIW
jgi:hypothetical protein